MKISIDKIKALAKDSDNDIVIALYVDFDNDKIGFTSYGKTKERCEQARIIGNYIHDNFLKALNGEIEIPPKSKPE